ncbi:VIT family protein [Candidatus Saccharibacteria bacterium]|nr:VIT family protein [Candidatus Saccharibacteria bacterium]
MPEFDNTKYELPSDQANNQMLNRLRAAVLGANDGIVSISALVMGVAGASNDTKAITIAGLAALIAGALSMAVGEYVSVSSQSDAEKAYIKLEKEDLRENPEYELDELAREYVKLGLTRKTADAVARELTKKDALRAHLHVHFNLDPNDINNPWQAAMASLFAFTAGGLVPFLTIILAPASIRIAATACAVLVALFAVGYISAHAGNANKPRAISRVVVGGLAAMAITYYVGVLFGTAVG